MKRYIRSIVCAILAILVFFPADGEESGLTKVRFMTHWSPQAQFAGYYVAREKGFYEKYGIDLEMLSSGPNYSAADYLVEGKTDIAVLWLTQAVQKHSGGAKLVNLAQMVQRSGLMLVARKSDGIVEPGDLNGEKVGIWEGDLSLQPKAFLKKYGLNVETVRQSYTVNLFLAGGVDAVSAMWYNEYHTILNSGVNPDELTTFFFSDHGLNFPEDGIYALKGTFTKNPDLFSGFVKASVEGWLYAFAHPKEAVDIVLEYMRRAKVPANRVHQMWMLERFKDLMMPGGDESALGRLDREEYERVAAMLKEAGLIVTVPDFDTFFVPAGEHAEK